MVGFYKHDIPAWMDGTEALSDGAYRAYHVIVQLIMLNEGPIARNERGIAGRCNQPLRSFRKHLQELLDRGKLTLDSEGRLANERAENELDTVRNNRVNAGKGGKISGNVRKTSEKSPETSEKSPETSGFRRETSEKKPGDAANPLKNNDLGQATLQEDRSLKEKRREEKSREEKNDPLPQSGTDLPAPWDDAYDAKPASDPQREYAFEAGIIRLNQRDWDQWKRSYPNLNLAGELTAMADWADRLKAEGKNWFKVLPNQLVKKDREAREGRERSRIEAESRARFMTEQAARSSRPAI